MRICGHAIKIEIHAVELLVSQLAGYLYVHRVTPPSLIHDYYLALPVGMLMESPVMVDPPYGQTIVT